MYQLQHNVTEINQYSQLFECIGVSKKQLHVKKITEPSKLIEHAQKFARNLSEDGVAYTSKNRHTVVCSTIFALAKNRLHESSHLESGKKLVNILKNLDQFENIPVTVGSQVAIINMQLQGDSAEIWGFTQPKTISRIFLDPSDKTIKQFEFNSDPNDIWPRTENAEYQGQFLMYSAFFSDVKSAENALLLLMLQSSTDLDIRNHVTRPGISENTTKINNQETVGDGISYSNNQEITMNQATNHMNQLLSRLNELDSTQTKKQTVTESIDVSIIKHLTDKLQSGEITYDEFRDRLDSEEYTDHSMRQGEMGMYGGDTPAGHRAWDRERSDWDAVDDDDHDDEDDEFREQGVAEGYETLPPMDTERYTQRKGLEGPFRVRSGKVVYYDPREGKYYDPDTDMYISHDDYEQMDKPNKSVSEKMEPVEECGDDMSTMSTPSMPKTPASINMTAASGQELSSMLKDLMSLAGVHKVEPEHMPTLTGKIHTKSGPDMRAIIDTMNDDVAHEAYDNTPADATDVPEYVDDQHAYDPNTGDHRQRQAGLPRANPTRPMPVEESLDQFTLKLFQEYKNYISQ